MRIRFAILVVFSMTSFSAFCSTDSKLFVDEQGRFSFSFSGDWRKLDKTASNVDGHFVVARSGKAVAEVVIAHETPKKKLTLDEYIENEKKRIEKTEGYTKINEDKGFQIGGFPASWILVNAKEKDIGGGTAVKKISQYFIKKDDVFWGIMIVASESDADVIADIQRTMVKSFEFGTGGKVSLEPIAKEGTKTVLDPDRRYSLKVPESWKLVETTAGELAMESDIGKMYVFVLPLEGSDAKTSASDFITKYEKLEKPHSINDAPFKIGSEKGHLINYEGKKSGNIYHVQLTVIPKEDFGFYIYFISSPKKWEDNLALIAGVQSTFSFIKSKISDKGRTGLPEFLAAKIELTENESETEGESKDAEAVPSTDVSTKLLWEPFSKDNVPK